MKALLVLIVLVRELNAQPFDYSFENNVTVNAVVQQRSLIASYKTQSELACLVSCNRNPNCLSCSFAESKNDDCFLFNITFTPSDLIFANGCHIFTKKSNGYTSASMSESGITSTTRTTTTTVTTTSTSRTSTSTETTTTVTTSSTSTTTTASAQRNCNRSLLCYIRTPVLNRTEKTADLGYNMATQQIDLDNTLYYFVAGMSPNNVYKLSSNWTVISNVGITGARGIALGNNCLYVTSSSGLYKLNYNLLILNSTRSGSLMSGIYYNSINDTVCVTSLTDRTVELYTPNFNQLWNVTFEDSPYVVAGYNDQYYVIVANTTKSNTTCYVVQNGLIMRTFPISTTVAQTVWAILIDDYGYMALPFSLYRTLNLFHVNGTDFKMKITTPATTNLYAVAFDTFNNILIADGNKNMYFYI